MPRWEICKPDCTCKKHNQQKLEIFCGVYAIINILDTNAYVGISNNIRSRFVGHYTKLNNNIHENPKLQEAWNHFGEQAFEFVIIEELLKISKETEQFYIDLIGTYNMMHNGKHSQETNDKISNSNKGKIVWLGRKHTEESKQKNREAHIGRKASDKTKSLMSQSRKEYLARRNIII